VSTDRSLLREAPSALAARIRSRELSARELVGASLSAIEADDAVLGAFVAVDGDRALAEAATVDERVAAGEDVGPLGGVPLAVNDNEDAVGFTTTVGSAWRRDDPPATRDSILVAKLRAAGCVVVGKTNTPELAWKGDTINAWGGATSNPWSPTRSAGGSSGGSAAAVAAGLVPLATASDGGGSIRIPAAVCGLTGFKPSLGRIASGGPTPPGWPDLSTKGLLTSRLAGAVEPLDLVLGPDPTDLRSLPRPDTPWTHAVGELGAPYRVAWSPTLGYADVDAEVLAACERAVGVLADLGAEVEEVPEIWPDDPVWDWLSIVSAGNARTLAPLRGTPSWDEVDPGLTVVADYGAARSGADVFGGIDAAHRRNLALVEVFHRASVLLCPTVAGQTAVLGGDGSINGETTPNWIQLTYGFNLTRSPAGTVCAGFTADGMPIGLQVVGPQHGDVAVLRCLLLLEQALGLDTTPPAYRFQDG
jgi:aspartyl-tRNA(Asn)/glutamyl-tRNA(Gln) amidotransferase subunit A